MPYLLVVSLPAFSAPSDQAICQGGRIRLLFLLLLPFCHALPTQVTVNPTAADSFGDSIVPEPPQKSDPPLPQDGRYTVHFVYTHKKVESLTCCGSDREKPQIWLSSNLSPQTQFPHLCSQICLCGDSSSTLRRATQNSGGSAQILREETTLMEETTQSDSQNDGAYRVLLNIVPSTPNSLFWRLRSATEAGWVQPPYLSLAFTLSV